VFDAADLVGAATPTNGSSKAGPTGAVTMSVGELLAGGKDGVVVPTPRDEVSAVEKELVCQVLEIPITLFAKVAPKVTELPFLAHVRQVAANGQSSEPQPRLPAQPPRAGVAADDDSGWYALVVANRRPTAGSTGIAHLVSLEGHEALLDGKTTETETDAWLVSLASWTFTATHEDSPTFRTLAAGVVKPRAGERQDLALGLPCEGDDAVSDRLTAGFVPIGYHLPTGEDTFAWYRGPFAARPSAPLDKKARPFRASSAALVYEPATGLFDVSLAVAWEIGRAAALADRKFATELVRFRRAVHRLVDLVLGGLESQHIDTTHGNLQKIAKSGLIQERFLDHLKDGLVEQVAALSKDAPPPRPPAKSNASTPEQDPVGAVKKLLEGGDIEKLIASEAADDVKPIAAWLASLTHLHLVPFAYLVPHPDLLPDESIRFFEVDRRWINALFDGALGVGVASSRDSWFQSIARSVITRAWRRTEHAPAAAGFLLRSALVSGWPGLEVTATKGKAPLELLRSDSLAPNVLLCLLSGIPDQVQICAPHQTLHFEVKDKLPWRESADGVLDVAAAAEAAGATGAATFALSMLAAREELTFGREP
jgi:hypothetical protein